MATPSILFNSKTAALSPEALKKVLSMVGGGAVTSGIMDAYQNQGDYSHFDKNRVLNLVVNSALGAEGGHLISKGPEHVGAGIGVMALAPAKDALLGVPAWMKQNEKFMKSQEGRSGFSPLEKGLALGGGALLLSQAMPALANISQAAKRIGSGHAVRVSTSVRHSNVPASDFADPEAPQITVPPEKEKPKGFLSRLLHLK